MGFTNWNLLLVLVDMIKSKIVIETMSLTKIHGEPKRLSLKQSNCPSELLAGVSTSYTMASKAKKLVVETAERWWLMKKIIHSKQPVRWGLFPVEIGDLSHLIFFNLLTMTIFIFYRHFLWYPSILLFDNTYLHEIKRS